MLRMQYWIPQATSLIRKVIRKRKQCTLDPQIMASLPFATTGIDFAGPFD